MQSINRKTEKSKNPHFGFTIIELLMVIGILSVLITITVSAITGSMQRARAQKASALCTLVEQGIATYYAKEDKWPFDALNNDNVSLNADASGNKNASEKVAHRLSDEEVQKGILELVNQTKRGQPVMDVSGLFVARKGGNLSMKNGMDFTSAVRGTKKNPEGIRLSQMAFGYPDTGTGRFRQFTVVYSPETDRVSVRQ